MSILIRTDHGWRIDTIEATPVEFWPYTTIVLQRVLECPMEFMGTLQQQLIDMFKAEGIKAIADNKTAFGLNDQEGKMWYLGFKDNMFHMGMGIRPDGGLKPITKKAL